MRLFLSSLFMAFIMSALSSLMPLLPLSPNPSPSSSATLPSFLGAKAVKVSQVTLGVKVAQAGQVAQVTVGTAGTGATKENEKTGGTGAVKYNEAMLIAQAPPPSLIPQTSLPSQTGQRGQPNQANQAPLTPLSPQTPPPNKRTSSIAQNTAKRFGGQTITLLTIEPDNGQTTAFYRLLPDFLQAISPDSLVLESMPGLGGAKAWHTLQRRRVDGSQMSAVTFPAFLLKPLAKEHYFTQKLTTPICILASAPMGLWVTDTSPIHDIPTLLDAIQANGNNTYLAGVGSFTTHHMANLLFNQAAGVTTDYLPYLGSAESSYAVQEGQALATWASATHHSAMPGMRLIGVASIERSHIYPTTPTFNESGIIMAISEQYGLALPAKSPEDTKQVASDLFIQMATNEAFVTKAHTMGYSITPAGYQDMEKLIEQQNETLKKFLEHFLFMSF